MAIKQSPCRRPFGPSVQLFRRAFCLVGRRMTSRGGDSGVDSPFARHIDSVGFVNRRWRRG